MHFPHFKGIGPVCKFSCTLLNDLPTEMDIQGRYFGLCYSKALPVDKWVPVNTVWRVRCLRLEERPPVWKVTANTLNKQSRTADKGSSSNLGVGRGVHSSSS